jgi:hypothetical protein
MNEKNQVTQERLHSEDRKKNTKNDERDGGMAEKAQRNQGDRKATNSSKLIPGFSEGGKEAENTITGKTALVTDWKFQLQNKTTTSTSPKSSGDL